MGRDNLQLVKRYLIIIVTLAAICCTAFWVGSLVRSPGNPEPAGEGMYPPLISHNGNMYLIENDDVALPQGAAPVGQIDVNLNSAHKKPNHDAPQKFVTNYYDVGTPIFLKDDTLYLVVEGKTIQFLPDN